MKGAVGFEYVSERGLGASKRPVQLVERPQRSLEDHGHLLALVPKLTVLLVIALG